MPERDSRAETVKRDRERHWLEQSADAFLGLVVVGVGMGVALAFLRSQTQGGRGSEPESGASVSCEETLAPLASAGVEKAPTAVGPGFDHILTSEAVPSGYEEGRPPLDTEIVLEEAYAALEPAERIPSHELRLRVARRMGQDGVLQFDAAEFCRILEADGRFTVELRRFVSLAGIAPRVNPFDAAAGIELPEGMDQAS